MSASVSIGNSVVPRKVTSESDFAIEKLLRFYRDYIRTTFFQRTLLGDCQKEMRPIVSRQRLLYRPRQRRFVSLSLFSSVGTPTPFSTLSLSLFHTPSRGKRSHAIFLPFLEGGRAKLLPACFDNYVTVCNEILSIRSQYFLDIFFFPLTFM